MRHRGPRRAPASAPATWRPIEVIPVFLLALVLWFALSAAIPSRNVAPEGQPYCSPQQFVLGSLFLEVAFVAAVVGWITLVNRGSLAALGLPRRPLADLIVGILAGALLVLLAGATAFLVERLAKLILGHKPSLPVQVASCVRGAWLVATGPLVVLAAPLGEETLFRGFLYKSLRRRWSVLPAAATSGALFGLIHFQGLSFLVIIPALALVGVGLALVYEYRQSLLASMAAHATFNLFGFLMIIHNR
jgi:membrane protease YdiL (CAAX protease family)